RKHICYGISQILLRSPQYIFTVNFVSSSWQKRIISFNPVYRDQGLEEIWSQYRRLAPIVGTRPRSIAKNGRSVQRTLYKRIYVEIYVCPPIKFIGSVDFPLPKIKIRPRFIPPSICIIGRNLISTHKRGNKI